MAFFGGHLPRHDGSSSPISFLFGWILDSVSDQWPLRTPERVFCGTRGRLSAACQPIGVSCVKPDDETKEGEGSTVSVQGEGVARGHSDQLHCAAVARFEERDDCC